MRREVFQGKDVLTTGRGQCERCTQIIVRVLTADRTWHTADIGNFGFIPHNCRPTGDVPAKKAA